MEYLHLRGVIYAGIIVALMLAGWWAWHPGAGGADVPIVFYLVDTLRADRLGIYGYGPGTSPQIDELAAESVVFDQAYAPSPWTLPSVASLITSTYPCEHRVLTERHRLNKSQPTLAQQLTKAGYFTAGRYSNVLVGANSGLDRGYSVFEPRKGEKQSEMSGHLKRILGGIGDNPFFLYLHTVEPHDAYTVAATRVRQFGYVSNQSRELFRDAALQLRKLTTVDWSAHQPIGSTRNSESQDRAMTTLENLQQPIQLLYDGAVFDADKNVGNVIAVLRELGVWDKAIFVFLSDHGEEFGEHGGWFHEQSMYEELARVPLMIRFPGGRYAGQRISTPVSLVDIMPTILNYVGRPELCEKCRGINLLPLLDGAEPVSPNEMRVPGLRINLRQSYEPWEAARGNVNVVVRQSRWKGIWNAEPGQLELYDLAVDPSEQFEVSAEHPELSAKIETHARRWLVNCVENQQNSESLEDVDQETAEHLRSLGYLN